MEEDIQNHSPTVMFRGTPYIYGNNLSEILNIFGNIDSTKKTDHILEMQELKISKIKDDIFSRLATVIFRGTP